MLSVPQHRAGSGAPVIDASVAHPARVWNYWLGGKDNYLIDQQVGDQVRALLPEIIDMARASREFLVRAVRYLAAEVGIGQFLDIGVGLPTVTNTHQVAQASAPQCRVVYVDNDPLVLAHARALLTSGPHGVTDVIHADLGDPETILRNAARTLELTQPVAVMLLGILHFITDTERAHAIVNRLLAALPTGSYLLLSHPTAEVHRAAMLKYTQLWNDRATPPITTRSSQELTRFFDRLELLDPGVVSCPLWRPDPHHLGAPHAVDEFCGVGRKTDAGHGRGEPGEAVGPPAVVLGDDRGVQSDPDGIVPLSS